jgi:hypothetical protein
LSRRFTEVRPPPNPEDLPADLRKQMEEPVPTTMTELEMAALNGELENQEDDAGYAFNVARQTAGLETDPSFNVDIPIPESPKMDTEIKRDKVDIGKETAQKAFDAMQQMENELTSKQVQQLTEYVKADSYDITFEGGITKRFYRVGLNQDLTEQIEDIQNQLETKLYLEGGEEISKRELRLLRKKLNKLGLNYLKDSSTHKTMTEAESKKVLPGAMLTSIIDACIYRTVHDIVDPKV